MEVFPKPQCNNGDVSLKKRKRAELPRASFSEDPDIEEGKLNSTDVNCKRQIHSKIEKRRRDKMNSYIAQLSTMIPTHNSNASKLDKITVLKMAVQYLKSIRVSPMQFNSTENLKYSFINDLEVEKLMLQVSEGFLFVVGCESARILYVSKSVSNILKCNSTELLGCNLYDIIHPYDTDKVKEQISCVDLNPKHQLVSIKSPKNLEVDVPSEKLGVHPGNRRSFFFRIKTHPGNNNTSSAHDNDCPYNGFKNTDEKNRFTTIQCSGYLKCWNTADHKISMGDKFDDAASVTTSFIAIGHAVSNGSINDQNGKPITFVSKLAVDGKFLFVDHRATIVTGYLPQEILGTNIYDYLHADDVNDFAATHQSMLQFPTSTIMSNNYRIRTKYGTFVKLQSEWKSLLNPWKKEVEYYYSKNTIVSWDRDTKFATENKEKGSASLYESELYLPEKHEHNFIMDFNFHCGKVDDMDTSMEAILKLLEFDKSIVAD